MSTRIALASLILLLACATAPASAKQRLHYAPLCPPGEQVRCFSGILEHADGTAVAGTSETAGWTAPQLQLAYGVQGDVALGGAGRTVAVVDAFDDPHAESDLATYRAAYGLPPCTSASGCFRKLNQAGQTSPLPKRDRGWAGEISLDLDMVSAICPNCHIVLVEANSSPRKRTDPIPPTFPAAEQTAFAQSPSVVSNSWGFDEQQSQLGFDSQMQPPTAGTAVVAASGDLGYGTEWPASAPNVISVGGTVLMQDSATTRGWDETVWAGTGSGCSSLESQPSWQSGLVPGCGQARVMNDVAAVATNLAVYDTYQSPGWTTFHGTSASAPIVAAMIALAGGKVDSPRQLYTIAQTNPTAFNDITSGSNGGCSVEILCQAQVGYDGPTGLGSPKGIQAFQPTGGSSAPTSQELAAGYAQTCGLRNGGVDCWGQNYFGQLGNGTTTGSTTPVAVDAIASATAVGSGTDVSCALLSAGGVDCWGSNFWGSLGDGTTTDSTTPVPVTGVSDATMISTGGLTGCALLSGGNVVCWGYDSDGQLGDGAAFNNNALSTVPVPVSGIANASALSTGAYHACALLSGGSIKCWGRDINGQLGDGTTTSSSTPVPVTGITNATAVSAGGYHTCALLTGGTIDCWGQNAWGELGDGTTNDSATPVPVSGITNAIAVSAGLDHTCALLADGSATCWGRGDYGQLGDGSFGSSTTPVPVSGVTGATALSAGGFHTCARLGDGTVECWGRDTDGQLGDGTTTDSAIPVPVTGFP